MGSFNKNDYIFKNGDESTDLFILNQGAVECQLIDSDVKYRLFDVDEPKSILGIEEVLLKTNRIGLNKVISDTAEFQNIYLKNKSLDNTILQNPVLGLQISINLAKRLQSTNSTVTNVTNMLKKVKSNSDEYCLEYYNLCEEFKALNARSGYPWMEKIYNEGKQNLIYSYGLSVKSGKDILEEMVTAKKSLSKEIEKKELDVTKAKEFKKGEVLCNEGEIGSDIYILGEGELSVYVGEHKVAEISDKGSIIGEIAVLVGLATKNFEKRTATVKSKSDSKVIVLPGDKISLIIQKDPNLILHISKTLAERIPKSYDSFLQITEKVVKATELMNPYLTTSACCPKAFENFLGSIDSHCKDKSTIDKQISKTERLLSDCKQAYSGLEAIPKTLISD